MNQIDYINLEYEKPHKGYMNNDLNANNFSNNDFRIKLSELNIK